LEQLARPVFMTNDIYRRQLETALKDAQKLRHAYNDWLAAEFEEVQPLPPRAVVSLAHTLYRWRLANAGGHTVPQDEGRGVQ